WDEYDLGNLKANWHWLPGDSPTKVTTDRRPDGSIDVITVKPDGTVDIQNNNQPDPLLQAKAQSDADVAKINAQIEALKLKAAQAQDANAAEEARIALEKAKTDLQIAQTNQQKAQLDLEKAGQPPQSAPVAAGTTQVTRGGAIYVNDGQGNLIPALDK